MAFPNSKEFPSYLLFCCDLGLIASGIVFLGNDINRRLCILFLIFLITSTCSYFQNASEISVATHLNGLREYLILFSAYSFVNVVLETKYLQSFSKTFYRFARALLLIQIPTVLYQFSKYGPGDNVGGTFGRGFSGGLTTIIFVLCFFLAWRLYNLKFTHTFNLRINCSILPFTLPVLLNETKISYAFLFLFFIFQLNLKTKALLANILLVLFAAVTFSLYEKYTASGVQLEVIYSEDFLTEYLAKDYEIGDDTIDIPRFTKIKLAMEILSHNLGDMLFGKGIGMLKGSKVLDRSEASKKFRWLLAGSRPYLFFLLIQGGILNTLIILLVLFYPLLKFKNKPLIKSEKGLPLKNLQFFMAAILISILFYNDFLRHGALVMIISFISILIYKEGFSKTFLKNRIMKSDIVSLSH